MQISQADWELLKTAKRVVQAAIDAELHEFDTCLLVATRSGHPVINKLGQKYEITTKDFLTLLASDIVPDEATRFGGFTLRAIALPCALYLVKHFLATTTWLEQKLSQ
ncbi:MAG: hypothetical protein ACK4SL_03275 [Candidatus Paceibacteria bacterium]